MKNIAMKCNQSQFDAIKPILEYNNKKILKVTHFNKFHYLVNVKDTIFNTVSPPIAQATLRDWTLDVYEEWNPFLFLEFCGIKNVGWSIKVTIDNVDLLVKYFKTAQINFDEQIKTMFKASNSNQIKVLESIFGKPQKTIEFDKLKPGSCIRLKQNCFGNSFNYEKPVFIVFRNNGYMMNAYHVTTIDLNTTTIMQDGVFYSSASSSIDEEIIKVEKY